MCPREVLKRKIIILSQHKQTASENTFLEQQKGFTQKDPLLLLLNLPSNAVESLFARGSHDVRARHVRLISIVSPSIHHYTRFDENYIRKWIGKYLLRKATQTMSKSASLLLKFYGKIQTSVSDTDVKQWLGVDEGWEKGAGAKGMRMKTMKISHVRSNS